MNFRLGFIALSVFFVGCVANVKKEYVPMAGASPSMPKQQALAQCGFQAEQIAQQRYQQELATFNQRSQQTQTLFNTRTSTTANCFNTGGLNFNCNATSYDNSVTNQLLGQVAAGRPPIYLGARSSDVEACMRGMGFAYVEVQPQQVQQITMLSSGQRSANNNVVTRLSAASSKEENDTSYVVSTYNCQGLGCSRG